MKIKRADSFLDYLTEDGMYDTVDVCKDNNDSKAIELKLVAHDEIGGAELFKYEIKEK